MIEQEKKGHQTGQEFEFIEDKKELSPNDEFVLTTMESLFRRMEKVGLLDLLKVEVADFLFMLNNLREEYLSGDMEVSFIEYLEEFTDVVDENRIYSQFFDQYMGFFNYFLGETKALMESFEQGYKAAYKEKTGEDLEDLIYKDILTGVFNRRAFDRDIKLRVNDQRENSPPFSLIIIDFDNFKSVNDSFGHLGGDRALSAAAQLIEKLLRGGDKLYRYGGDEFAILAEGNEEEIRGLLERIQEAIRGKVFEIEVSENDVQQASFTFSMGAVSSERFAHRGFTEGSMVMEADMVLYEVKVAGRDGFKQALIE